MRGLQHTATLKGRAAYEVIDRCHACKLPLPNKTGKFDARIIPPANL